MAKLIYVDFNALHDIRLGNVPYWSETLSFVDAPKPLTNFRLSRPCSRKAQRTSTGSNPFRENLEGFERIQTSRPSWPRISITRADSAQCDDRFRSPAICCYQTPLLQHAFPFISRQQRPPMIGSPVPTTIQTPITTIGDSRQTHACDSFRIL